MIHPDNILQHELIGLRVEITDSSCGCYIGLKGKIVDETRNTILIMPEEIERPYRGRKRELRIPKKNTVFKITVPASDIATQVEVRGSLLAYPPEDRVKRCAKRYKR